MGGSSEHLVLGVVLVPAGQHRQAAEQFSNGLRPCLRRGPRRLWTGRVVAGALGVPLL